MTHNNSEFRDALKHFTKTFNGKEFKFLMDSYKIYVRYDGYF